MSAGMGWYEDVTMLFYKKTTGRSVGQSVTTSQLPCNLMTSLPTNSGLATIIRERESGRWKEDSERTRQMPHELPSLSCSSCYITHSDIILFLRTTAESIWPCFDRLYQHSVGRLSQPPPIDQTLLWNHPMEVVIRLAKVRSGSAPLDGVVLTQKNPSQNK